MIDRRAEYLVRIRVVPSHQSAHLGRCCIASHRPTLSVLIALRLTWYFHCQHARKFTSE